MIAYTSPSIGGLVIDLQVGLSEASQQGRTQVLTANYDAGPLHLGAQLPARRAPGCPARSRRNSACARCTSSATSPSAATTSATKTTSAPAASAMPGAPPSCMRWARASCTLNVGYAGQVRNFGIRDDDAQAVHRRLQPQPEQAHQGVHLRQPRRRQRERAVRRRLQHLRDRRAPQLLTPRQRRPPSRVRDRRRSAGHVGQHLQMRRHAARQCAEVVAALPGTTRCARRRVDRPPP